MVFSWACFSAYSDCLTSRLSGEGPSGPSPLEALVRWILFLLQQVLIRRILIHHMFTEILLNTVPTTYHFSFQEYVVFDIRINSHLQSRHSFFAVFVL